MVSRRGIESWLRLMREVEAHRLPLAFGRAPPAEVVLSDCRGRGGGDEECGRRHLPGCGEQGRDAIGASLRAVYGGGG